MARGRMGELEVIRRIQLGVATKNAAVRVGIGDDCAILKTIPGNELVVTTDFCLEGRHFRQDWHSAESAGHRCLARGLSDVAAMGGRPVAAFLSLALPVDLDEAWLAGFLRGFEALSQEFGVELAGGDTSESPRGEVLADVTVIGTLAKFKAMRRAGARVGDGLYVTGSLGGSAAELASLAGGSTWKQEARPQSFPVPRVALGQALMRRGYPTACMDLSDGLSSDLRHLCEASKVRAVVDTARIPVAAGATLEQALHGGEDYELLFTAMAGVKVPGSLLGVPMTRIGTMVGGDGPLVTTADGLELAAGGWEHL